AERRVFVIAQAPLTLSIREANHTMDRVVRPQPSAYRVGEDRAEQTHRSCRRAAAATDPRQPAPLRLDACGGFALSDAVHKALDVSSRHRSYRPAAEQRFKVPLDPAAIDRQRTCLLRLPASRQQSASLSVGKVCVTQFGNGNRFARLAFVG